MLTDTEIEKLEQNNPRDRANDFIVRRKFKKWLDGLSVVFVIILRYLPERQTKKLITDSHIGYMSNILLHLFSIMAVPMVKKTEHEYTVVLPNRPPRRAEPGEINLRDNYIKPLIHGLFRHLSAEDVRDVIENELGRNMPDLILVKKAFAKYPSYVKEEPTNSSKTQIVIY